MEENFNQERFVEPHLSEIDEENIKKEALKKKLRFSANRIGWATVLMIAIWMGAMFSISMIVAIVEYTVGARLPFSVIDIYNQYLVLFNEITLALAMAVAVLFLLSMPKADMEKRPFEFPLFLKTLLMCFGVGYLGNLIGTAFLGVWNAVTGNSAGDELTTLLYDANSLTMLISTVILAPILEELFFRKLLIDRLRPFGKTVSVLLPAFLFALFHQNAAQMIYAFAIGAVLAYFYYEKGKYWPCVAIHALFNWIAGFIPMQFLPKLEGFVTELEPLMNRISETADPEEIAAQMLPLLETYGVSLALYAVYALLLFAINITGVVVFFISLGKFFKNREKNVLGFSETVKIVMLNPGMIAVTVVLAGLTIFSLFM